MSVEGVLLRDPAMPESRCLAAVETGSGSGSGSAPRRVTLGEGATLDLGVDPQRFGTPSWPRLIADASTSVEALRRWALGCGGELGRAMATLTDKGAFRRSVAGLEGTASPSSVCVSRAQLAALPSLSAARARLGEEAGAVVIKPARGASSALVFACGDEASFAEAKGCYARARATAGACPATVDGESVILEAYVEGTELAVDLVFDDEGRAVILGVYVHPFAGPGDVRDSVYRCDGETVARYGEPLRVALDRWNTRWQLRRFPAHLEVRATASGQLFPIECNPLRFGLLTADVGLAAFGLNPYTAFFRGQRPDWSERVRAAALRDDRAAAFIVGHVPGAGPEHAIDLDRLRAAMARAGLEVLHDLAMPAGERPYVSASYVRGESADIDAFLLFDFAELTNIQAHVPE